MTANTQQANLPGYDENGYPVVSTHDPAIVSGGTDVEIQAALDGLTSGRTWKEKVILKGQFTATAKITIPSYTILEIQGQVVSTDIAVGNLLFDNADATNTDIEILGGSITTSSEVGSTAINMDGVSNLLIRDVRVYDVGTHGIALTGCNDFTIQHCDVDNYGDDGISVLYSYDGVIDNNTVTGGGNDAGTGSSGIEVEDSSHDIVITNNVITGITTTVTSGIHCVTDSGGPGGVYNLTIANNVIRDCDGKGIGVVSSKASKTIASMSVLDGVGPANIEVTGHGLSANHTSMVIIENVDDTGLTSLNGTWIATYVDANNFTIPAAVTGTFAGDGDVYFDAMNCNIVGNVIDDVGTSGVQVTRGRNIACLSNSISRTGDDGYVTNQGCENCSISGNTFYQCEDMAISLYLNDKMLVSGNIINECGYDQNNHYAIQLNTVTNSLVTGNVITAYSETPNYTRGINSLTGGTNTITNNDVSGAATVSGTRVTITAGDIKRDNIGDKTRASGSTGAIATGATVAHGLIAAPTNVKVTPKDSGTTAYHVTADATNLTITYTGGATQDFWWEASVNEE